MLSCQVSFLFVFLRIDIETSCLEDKNKRDQFMQLVSACLVSSTSLPPLNFRDHFYIDMFCIVNYHFVGYFLILESMFNVSMLNFILINWIKLSSCD